MLRKAMSMGTPSLSIKQYFEDDVTHIDVVLTATAGIKGEDKRVLNWIKVTKKDGMFGEVEGVYLVPYYCDFFSPHTLLISFASHRTIALVHYL